MKPTLSPPPAGFQQHGLDESCHFASGAVPADLNLSGEAFGALWALHPQEFNRIRMPSGYVELPRWQRNYGRDYRFSGQTQKAGPLVDELVPFLDWAREAIDRRMNGLLVNWYDGRRGHYIGRHCDSTVGLVGGTPIVTVSLGEDRLMRFRSARGRGRARFDHPISPGSVILIPCVTNARWSHEVPAFKRWAGRRISLTLRAFC